jgi:hypothetical protein
MTSLGKSARRFMSQRGFTYKRAFWKYLPERSLLVEVSFRPIKAAFAGQDTLGYAIGFYVYYPAGDRFILVSPAELADLRRDGTLRHVVYTSERDGIFEKSETEVVEALLRQWFDFWYEKLTEPQHALEAIKAIRGRASPPSYLSYISNFIAKDDAEKLEFAARQEACIFPFDGGVNFTSYAAYLNAAGRFADAHRLIEAAIEETFFRGQRHAPVVLHGSLMKIANDAAQHKIALSESNLHELTKLGLSPV